jgi:hypothetical protein
MKGLATGIAAGAIIAVILAGAVVGALDLWGAKATPEPPEADVAEVVRLGPDGTSRTTFGDDVQDVIVPRSRTYDFCYGELRVKRPSMMTTGMPDAFCSLARQSAKGPWRVTTGGWQDCQAVCVRFRR